MAYLQSINRPGPGSRMGGILTLDVVRAADVESMPDPVNGAINGPVVLKAGATFVRWVAGYYSTGISSNSRQNREGTSKANALPFFLPLDVEAIRNQLALAEEDEFIVVYKYATGKQKIFGTKTAPVRFEFSHDSGRLPTDAHGHNCRFYYSGPDNTYFYNADAPVPTPGPAPCIVYVNGEVVASLTPGQSIHFDTAFDFTFEIVGT